MKETAIVENIVQDDNRALIYFEGGGEDYYIISTRSQAAQLSPGDRVEYEPYGANCGRFLRKL